MTLPAAFLKRIKRQVTARDHDYFAVTAPGLERLCAQELARLDPSPTDLKITNGGVAFRGRLTTLYLANLHLRTATRVRMRLTTFKATRFDQISRRLADLPWELFLWRNQACEIQVSTRHSRLYHREAIAEQVEDSMAGRLTAHGQVSEDASATQYLHIRLDQDTATLSLDSSGPALYKRGFKTQGARAPLRETLAAAILIWAGFQPGRPLVDPLCGGGTFSLEAALMALEIPPGMKRNFAFEGWPAFRLNHWRHLRRTARSGERATSRPQIFASDREADVCSALRSEIERHGLAEAVTVSCSDFNILRPEDLPQGPLGLAKGLIVLNPPYGVRLGSPHAAHREIAAMGRHLRTHWKGWRAAVILPKPSLASHFGRPLTLRPLRHGGLELRLMIAQLP